MTGWACAVCGEPTLHPDPPVEWCIRLPDGRPAHNRCVGLDPGKSAR